MSVTITAKVKRETEKAILVSGDDYDGWLPKSQIAITELEGGVVEIAIPEWLAEKKGIIADVKFLALW